MITFKLLRFPFVVCIPHTVNELVTDIILNITSHEYLMLTLFGSKLFELFSKEVLVKKQPGRPLILRSYFFSIVNVERNFANQLGVSLYVCFKTIFRMLSGQSLSWYCGLPQNWGSWVRDSMNASYFFHSNL